MSKEHDARKNEKASIPETRSLGSEPKQETQQWLGLFYAESGHRQSSHIAKAYIDGHIHLSYQGNPYLLSPRGSLSYNLGLEAPGKMSHRDYRSATTSSAGNLYEWVILLNKAKEVMGK